MLLKWKPNKPRRKNRFRKSSPKVTPLRRKYGPQWWKADPTIDRERSTP